MRDVVIAAAARTAVGSLGGGLKTIPAITLGEVAAKEALKRAGLEPAQIDEVILGNVLQAGLGQNPARQVAVNIGIPIEVPAFTVNKVCGSGLKTVALAAQAVKCGDADIVLAGGMESMSGSPYVATGARWGNRMGDVQMVDSMIKDGLWCAFGNYHMGITAENIAERFNITREQQDEVALRSQQRAIAAIDEGRFKEEIVPVSVPQKKKDPISFEVDEHPRRGTNMEILGKLPGAFKKGGTVTAGNSSGINDGGAAIIVMSGDKAKELGITPLAVIKSYATMGVDPSIMGIGPIPSSKKALEKAGLTIADMDLVEANEAFAAQVVYITQELGLDPEKTNVNGGAVALGHPIGASGARILTTLLYEMKRRQSHYGLATLCIGGGQGIAMVVERP